MDTGPGSDLGSLSFYVVAWVVMMAAMMFPSISPMVRTYALIQRSRYARRGLGEPTAAIGAFVAGYLLIWTVFGLTAYAVLKLRTVSTLSRSPGIVGDPTWPGGVILASAIYQLTPLKDACLSRCRSPLGFLTERWRDGVGEALVLGLEHGAWCVGCCWALMAALFALGVMSIAWMVLIAGLIARSSCRERPANRAIADPAGGARPRGRLRPRFGAGADASRTGWNEHRPRVRGDGRDEDGRQENDRDG